MCTVISRTPSLPSSRIGASAAWPRRGLRLQRLDEAAERHAAVELVLARQLRDVQHVGQRLLAAGAQHEADVRARSVEQRRDRVGDGPPVALRDAARASSASASRTGSRCERQRLRARGTDESASRAGGTRAVPRRRSRTARRAAREHRQLIVGPLDRHQRRAQRLDLLAVVERPAADEQVADAARFERVDVRPRDVLAVADEAPEQDADVARLDRHRRRRACRARSPSSRSH